MGIGVGDPVALRAPLELGPGRRVTSKALDDRMGCAVLLELARRWQRRQPAGDVCFTFTVQEEVGLRGAQVAAAVVRPDYAVAVDTMPSGDTPDVPAQEVPVRIGGGPALILASGNSGRGSLAQPTVVTALRRAAAAAAVDLQPTLLLDHGTNDASAIHLVGTGVPAAALAIGRRYAHSAAERADLADADATVSVLDTFIGQMPQHPIPKKER